jgi:hypothetical protein
MRSKERHMRSVVFDSLARLARRLFAATALGTGLSLVGVLFGAGLQACGSGGEDSTGGKLVRLRTRVTVDDVARETFTTSVGWNVTLREARVAAGPFYYFDGAPPLVRYAPPTDWRFATRLLGLGIAHAHPGHYQAGNAMGQMLEAANVDLLGGIADLPDGAGVSGTYRSARFSFSSWSAAGSSELDGHVALAIGKAEKDGEDPHFFRAFADFQMIEKSASLGHVDGCEFSEIDVERDGTVTVTVNPKIWFDLVDFAQAEVGRDDAPAEFPEDSQPQRAFVLGTTQLSAYKFSFTSP